MERKDILDQINEAHRILNKLEDILISVSVDVEYELPETADDDIKDALLSICLDYHWDPDSETDLTYEDNPEKREAFFQGVKYGYSSALFWMADYFDLVAFFEQRIGHNFENLKKQGK